MFDREYDLRPLRFEFIGKVLIFEPQTIERLALGWTARINLAACSFVAKLAPLIHRLVQRGDRHHLATERATSAGSHGTLSATRREWGDDERDLDPVKIGDGEAGIAASPTPSCDDLEMQTGATGYFVPRCAPARFRPIEAV